jgi:hypothetical protein
VTVACEPTGHRWRVLDQLATQRGLALVCVQPLLVYRAREGEDLTRDKSDPKDAVLSAWLASELVRILDNPHGWRSFVAFRSRDTPPLPNRDKPAPHPATSYLTLRNALLQGSPARRNAPGQDNAAVQGRRATRRPRRLTGSRPTAGRQAATAGWSLRADAGER